MADRNSREDRNRKKFALLKTILNARRQRQLMQQSILNHFIARRRLILKVCALTILLLSFHERSYLFSSCEPPSSLLASPFLRSPWRNFLVPSLPLLIHNLYWVKSGTKLCLLRQKVQKKILGTLSRHDDDVEENGTKKLHSRFLNKFAMICAHLVCEMWPNYPGANVVGVKVQKEKGKYIIMHSRSP